MKQLIFILFILYGISNQTAAQQNWTAVPCSSMRNVEAFNWMFIDSLHNEIILNSNNSYTICNTTFKGLVAYNGSGFHSLDKGVNTHDSSNPGNGGAAMIACIPFRGQTLFGGSFYSVGTNTLFAKSIATWNGTVWDTFPKRCFSPVPNNSSGGGFYGFLKWLGKLWMYGGFDTIGNTITKNLTAYDGNTFIPVPTMPASDYQPIVKAIIYKDKFIASGNFDNYPNTTLSRVAQFDGTTWSSLGTGVLGNLSGVFDMAIYKDTLYIAGAFPKSAGNAGNYIMKWDGTQLRDAGFGGFCGYGSIQSLVQFRNRLYAFGNFQCAAGEKAFGVAYLENGIWTVPQDSIENNSITGAVAFKDAIYICGGFNSINGDNTIRKFAKMTCPDFDAAAGCVSGMNESSKTLDIKIFPNPTNDKIHLEFEQNRAMDKVSITNALGQEVYMLLKPEPNKEIDISHLTKGIYLLQVNVGGTMQSYKIIKQ